MFLTESFVFLHVPKTGGTFVHKVLARHLGMRQLDGRHSAYGNLTEAELELPVLCVVRNPWDWYVSWYHHQLAVGIEKSDTWSKRAIWEQLFDSGRADFATAVGRACRGGFRHRVVAMMEAEGLDFYSASFRSILGEALAHPGLRVLRFEDLRRELLAFLEEHVEVSPGLRHDILHRPPRRTSEHAPYPAYYDTELMELVGAKTAWLRGRFPYEFDAAASGPPPSSDGNAVEDVDGERLVRGEGLL